MAELDKPVQESKDVAYPIISASKPKPKIWEKKTGVKDYYSLPDQLKMKRDEISLMFKEVIRWRAEVHKLIGTSDKKMITLEAAFAIMDQIDEHGNAVPFSLTYVTYNDSTKEGGQVIKARSKVRFKETNIARYSVGASKIKKNRKNPHHSVHGTMTLQWVNTLEIRTVHTYLIFEINDRPVSISNYG